MSISTRLPVSTVHQLAVSDEGLMGFMFDHISCKQEFKDNLVMYIHKSGLALAKPFTSHTGKDIYISNMMDSIFTNSTSIEAIDESLNLLHNEMNAEINSEKFDIIKQDSSRTGRPITVLSEFSRDVTVSILERATLTDNVNCIISPYTELVLPKRPTILSHVDIVICGSSKHVLVSTSSLNSKSANGTSCTVIGSLVTQL